ncbi:MAG: GDP-mannose 4,6-dehydratase [Balneolaceae bacterium]
MPAEDQNITAPEIGILEWFRVGEYEHVELAIKDLKHLGVRHLRTGLSWADWYSEEGKEWISWLIPHLAGEFQLLPCLTYTPPSIGIEPKTSSPPRKPESYVYFVEEMISLFGDYFDWVELWNEPNNTSEWDWRLDPDWDIFSTMIKNGAKKAQEQNKKVLLGGMSPIDPNWLNHMFYKRAMKNIDAIGIHGFPDVFDTMWEGWENNLLKVQEVLDNYNSRIDIWITEAGYSTWQHDENRQLKEFIKAAELQVPRIYWYSLYDLDPDVATVDGFHVDERSYYFGLKKNDGTPKLLYKKLAESNLETEALKSEDWLDTDPLLMLDGQRPVLITGGAGFIGTNVASKFLEKGQQVLVLDNLSRSGVENNLKWLKKTYGKKVHVNISDVRNLYNLKPVVQKAGQVFHFAGQVAVTTSLTAPVEDFEINTKGTLNLLESIKSAENPPPVIFTSTNKVYGGLQDISLFEDKNQYKPESDKIRKSGVDENRNLDFHSPYGCSKGAADQYVRDYSRIYNIPAVVFRMSCIYGPHQYGCRDQGWVTHFMIQALEGNPITIYGDGKQVRDILFVDDLVNAFQLAMANINDLSGEVFNIGGGPENTVSLLQVINKIQEMHNRKLDVRFEDWRAGDQKYYVTDYSKFNKATGWSPQTDIDTGLERLYGWLKKNKESLPVLQD